MEFVCTACRVERADYEGPGKHLPTCPNCGSEANPVERPYSELDDPKARWRRGANMLRRIWRFMKDGPYAEQIAYMNASTERIRAATAIIEENTRRIQEVTARVRGFAQGGPVRTSGPFLVRAGDRIERWSPADRSSAGEERT